MRFNQELTQRRQAELQALRDRLSELTVATSDLQKTSVDYEANIKQVRRTPLRRSVGFRRTAR